MAEASALVNGDRGSKSRQVRRRDVKVWRGGVCGEGAALGGRAPPPW